MKTWLCYSVSVAGLLLLLAVLAGCGQDQSSRDDQAPSAPVWVQRTNDLDFGQSGIRPEPVQNDLQRQSDDDHWVHLDWYANPESDVVAYRIWRRAETDPNSLRHSVVKELRLGVDLSEGQSQYSWVDQGNNPDDGTTNNLAPDIVTGQSKGFYWEVQALDSAGNQSPFSPRIYYRLLANPRLLAVSRDTVNLYELTYMFTANAFSDMPLNDIVRVYAKYAGPNNVIYSRYQHLYAESRGFQLDFSNLATPPVPDCTYVCQVNVICNGPSDAHPDTLALAGAAAFTTFTYQP